MSKYQRNENPITGFLAGQFIAAMFAIPTAALLWFATNKHLAIWGPPGAFIGSTGFWLVIIFFSIVSVFIPNLFPSLLGKVWRGIINLEKWF